MHKTKHAGLWFLFLFLSIPRLANACPMCSALLDRGKDAFKMMNLSRGFASSIALMLAVPFALVALTGLMLWRASKKRGAVHE